MSDKKASSRVKERSVIKYLVAEGCKAVEIHRKMLTVYARPNHFLRSFVNSGNYCKLLKQVKKDIKNKRRGHQSKGVILSCLVLKGVIIARSLRNFPVAILINFNDFHFIVTERLNKICLVLSCIMTIQGLTH